eukprot:TRINITY_DN7993_c0_g3_i3.p1 TRINITY_DN7993_c0_g3~~TRINITY_DN7993_c0_g3_i3.p1  ORF type:complete len:271 (-),score=41.49 TRINITY_DN7993_c0_g3_i3:62-874(-)
MRATKTYEHIMFFIEFGYTRFQLPHVPSLLALSCDETMWNFLAPRVYPEEDLPWGQEIWKCKNCRNTYTSLYRLEFHQTHHENLTSELCVTSNLHDTRLVIEIIMLNNYLSVMDLQNFSSTCTDLLHLESCVWPILAPQFGHGKVSVCMFCRRIYKNSENDSNLCRLPLNFFNEPLEVPHVPDERIENLTGYKWIYEIVLAIAIKMKTDRQGTTYEDQLTVKNNFLSFIKFHSAKRSFPTIEPAVSIKMQFPNMGRKDLENGLSYFSTQI